MFEWYNTVVSWLPWVGVPAVAGLGVLWWLAGGATVLKILATVFDIISPLLKGIVTGLVSLWENIFWPGLKNIFSQMVTLITVVTMGVILYTAQDVRDDIMTNRIMNELSSCKTELRDIRKSIPRLPKGLNKAVEKVNKAPEPSFWKFPF